MIKRKLLSLILCIAMCATVFVVAGCVNASPQSTGDSSIYMMEEGLETQSIDTYVWNHGFFPRVDSYGRTNYEVVPLNSWVHYKSPNLVNVQTTKTLPHNVPIASPTPKTITGIFFGGIAHQFQGRFDNIKIYGIPTENHVANGDFEDGLTDWTESYYGSGNRYVQVIYDGTMNSDVLEYKRWNSGGSGGKEGVYQPLNIDVTQYSELYIELDVKVMMYTLSNSGWWSDVYGGAGEWPGEVCLWYIGNQAPVADAGSDQTINEGDTVYFDGSSSYDPDGTIVNYEWDFGDGTSYSSYSLDVMETDQITNAPYHELDPRWGPDGQKIAISAWTNQWYHDIIVMNADGTGQQQLTTTTNLHERFPMFSPDGSKIAYVRGSVDTGYGNYDIWVMNADGSNKVALTSNPSYDDRNPAWSLDGSEIYFASDRTSGYELWVMDSDGSNVAQVTSGMSNVASPKVSPDGNKVGFSSSVGGRYEAMVLDLESGIIETLASDPVINVFFNSWSPDGKYILFSKSIGTGSSVSEFWVAKTDGTDIIQVTFDGNIKGGGDWSPDGYRIAYRQKDGNIYNIHTLTLCGDPYASHVYGDNGIYTVTLTVTDDDGVTNTDTMTVTVENLAPSGNELMVNGDFSDGLNGWTQALFGYVQQGMPPLPSGHHYTSTDNGYLETGAQAGYNQVYQQFQVDTVNLDFHGRIKAEEFSPTNSGFVGIIVELFDVEPPEWSGNPPSYANEPILTDSRIGRMSWYIRPDYVYSQDDENYWEQLDNTANDWFTVNVNFQDILDTQLPNVDQNAVHYIRIITQSYGTNSGLTYGNYDDFLTVVQHFKEICVWKYCLVII